MTEKTEALRLADALKAATEQTDAEDDVIHVARWFVEDAAAELRRLHASCEDYAQHKQRQDQRVLELAERVLELKAQRDALLEALRWIADRCPVHLSDHPLHNIHKEMSHDAGARARAAIKAVE